MQTLYRKVVLFGDSIIQYSSSQSFGLAPALQDLFQRKADIITRGFSGYNSEWIRASASQIFAEFTNQDVLATVIFFGTNDAAARETKQHVPIERFKENIHYLATLAKEWSDLVILIGPAIVMENYGTHATSIRTNRRLLEYNVAVYELSRELACPFVDLWTAFRRYLGEDPMGYPLSGESSYRGPINPQILVYDGLHFSAKGYQVFFEELVRVMREANLDPRDLPIVLPDWHHIQSINDLE